MKTGKILWTPYPYKAGFCITDDIDAADFQSIKLVYDFLSEVKFPITKTAWAFSPEEPCGIPATPPSTLSGVTLENKDYFKYCKELYKKGFEICLHGASAGNNKRENTRCAIEFFKKNFGNPDTFICHSRNADNIYWEEKVVTNPLLRFIIKLYSSHKCYGEIPGSEYFWGDICKETINQIRLLRTRSTDTLALNPSMPYYNPKKPYVKGWFSATKRNIVDCTKDKALKLLKRDNGLTVLYQYLHRYADTKLEKLDNKFKKAIVKLVNDKLILKDTVTNIMRRLRLIHGIFVVYRDKFLWIINTNNKNIKNLQLSISNGDSLYKTNDRVKLEGNIIVIAELEHNSFVKIQLNRQLVLKGRNIYKLKRNLTTVVNFGFGSVHVNFSNNDYCFTDTISVSKQNFKVTFNEDVSDFRPMSKASSLEELRLLFGQIVIIMREIFFKGRSLRGDKFLGADEIKLENHDNW